VQSEHIRLIAAFNHVHIFVDPDPDPARSYRERKTAVRGCPVLPGSTTIARHYPKEERSTSAVRKSLTLSPAVKKRLGINKSKVSPHA